jgi:hypothetical protein
VGKRLLAVTLCATIGSVVAVFGGGCGSSSDDNSRSAHVQVTAPVDGARVRSSRISVRGTVSPADANVQVLGQPAQVSNGVFSSSVALHSGTNHIDVAVTAPDVNPATTAVTVIRPKKSAPGNHGSGGGTGGGSSSATGSSDCGDGLSVNSVTTCPFARNVRDTFEGSGGASVIDVYSPVTKRTYTMRCSSGLPTVCKGGNGAVVYIR